MSNLRIKKLTFFVLIITFFGNLAFAGSDKFDGALDGRYIITNVSNLQKIEFYILANKTRVEGTIENKPVICEGVAETSRQLTFHNGMSTFVTQISSNLLCNKKERINYVIEFQDSGKLADFNQPESATLSIRAENATGTIEAKEIKVDRIKTNARTSLFSF